MLLSVPLILGFGPTGIIGSSVAATIQATIGNVVAGSVFSIFQGLGAAGVTTAAAAVGATISTVAVV